MIVIDELTDFTPEQWRAMTVNVSLEAAAYKARARIHQLIDARAEQDSRQLRREAERARRSLAQKARWLMRAA